MLKNIQKNEQGRSMVEMLGVLAVIGVLSIAGIAGYTTAMKRHRANELLNEASKRAVVLAMKIAAGQTLPSTASNNLISEFTDPSDYTFEVLANSDTNKFDMQITGVSEEVCEQMKVMIGNDGMMSISDCTTSPLTLTFNKDLSKGSSTPSGPTVEEDATVDSCPMGSSTSYSGGDYTTKLVGYDRCQCVDATPVWNGTACMPLSTAKVCNSSTPCASGEYCRYKDVSGLSCYSNANGFPVTGSGSSTEVNGTCEKVVGVKKTIGGEFYYSTNYLDWFSAKSWCA